LAVVDAAAAGFDAGAAVLALGLAGALLGAAACPPQPASRSIAVVRKAIGLSLMSSPRYRTPGADYYPKDAVR